MTQGCKKEARQSVQVRAQGQRWGMRVGPQGPGVEGNVGERGTGIGARGGGNESERAAKNGCRKGGRGWDTISTVEVRREGG